MFESDTIWGGQDEAVEITRGYILRNGIPNFST